MTDTVNLDDHLELISSFKQLLSDVKGDLDVLKRFDDILNDEIESVSSAGSSEDSTTSNGSIPPFPKDATQLVDYKDGFISQDSIKPLVSELEEMFTTRHRKYTWLSKFNVPYKFGGVSHTAVQILNFDNIIKLMDRLNLEFNKDLDSCLVSRYSRKQQALSSHQDNEETIDQSSPICNISIGPTRIIEFTNLENAKVLEFKLEGGSLLKMNPGCQSDLSHRLLPGEDDSEVRYSLSFRKLNPDCMPKQKMSPGTHTRLPPRVSKSPMHPFMHPSRLPVDRLSHTEEDDKEEADKYTGPCHLIIGDSLTKGLNVKDTVILSKGGAHPKDILKLIHSSQDIIEPINYTHIKSVTICVGTNALNVTNSQCIPMMDILTDYNIIVSEFLKLFPNAKIGLFNVLPRVCYIRDTYNRIRSFNMFLIDHIASLYDRVECIVLYWEFVDYDGYLIRRLYGNDFLHLRPQGKDLMSNCITNFQMSVLPELFDIES